MGTNFYANIPFGERRTKKLKEYLKEMKSAIDNNNVDKFDSLIDDINFDWSEIKKECYVHLGKRSAGWAFCWDLNRMKYYKPSLDSIIVFLNTPGLFITDECGKRYTKDEFFDEIKHWLHPSDHPMSLEEVNESRFSDEQKKYIIEEYINKNRPYYQYCTSKTYHEMNPSEPNYPWYSDYSLSDYSVYAKNAIIQGESDFVTKDNIRCALYTDFS